MSSNYLTRNPCKTEFLLIRLPQQTSKIIISSLSLSSTQPIPLTSSARNLGFIFDSNLSFSEQISSLSSTCRYHICDLHRIRHTLNYTTAATITTSRVHFRLDYCNSLYHVLLTQIKRLQQIQNALASTVNRTLKNSHFTLSLRSLHWLKVEQPIHYKIISFILLNHNIFVNSLMSIHVAKIRSSEYLYLALPTLTSKLKFSNRSFHISAPHLWNSLPQNLCTRWWRNHYKYYKYHAFVSLIYLQTSIPISKLFSFTP